MAVRWTVSPSSLDPQFAADVDAVLGNSPYSWVVTRAVPAPGEQEALYKRYLAGGPLAAPPGHSAHELHPSATPSGGLAVDVAENAGGTVSWDTTRPAWAWLWETVRAHPRLHSGHDFPTPDDDHIEDLRWAYGPNSVRSQLKLDGAW